VASRASILNVAVSTFYAASGDAGARDITVPFAGNQTIAQARTPHCAVRPHRDSHVGNVMGVVSAIRSTFGSATLQIVARDVATVSAQTRTVARVGAVEGAGVSTNRTTRVLCVRAGGIAVISTAHNALTVAVAITIGSVAVGIVSACGCKKRET